MGLQIIPYIGSTIKIYIIAYIYMYIFMILAPEPAIRNNCHERSSALQDHILLQKELHFNITAPVTKDHLS